MSSDLLWFQLELHDLGRIVRRHVKIESRVNHPKTLSPTISIYLHHLLSHPYLCGCSGDKSFTCFPTSWQQDERKLLCFLQINYLVVF